MSFELDTKKEPDDVEPTVAYRVRILFEGVYISGSTSSLCRRNEGVWGGVEVIAGRACVVGDVAKVVGGLYDSAAMTARTGLGWGSGNVPLVDVVRLGFI